MEGCAEDKGGRKAGNKRKNKGEVEAVQRIREEGERPASLFALCSEQVLIVRPLKYRKCQIQSYSHAREEQYAANKSTRLHVQ